MAHPKIQWKCSLFAESRSRAEQRVDLNQIGAGHLTKNVDRAY